MTWIVGVPTIFGYGVGVSDVRVSWGTGQREDCLQKIYEVGRFVAAGFAGSVEIGFAMIQDLRTNLSIFLPDKACFPRGVANQWWRRGRRIFSDCPNSDAKQAGSSIMLIGASTLLPPGQLCPRSDVILMESQNGFEPRIAKPGKAVSIGSGGNVERYVSWLDEFMADDFPHMQFEVNNPGGMGQSIANSISMLIMRHPEDGVSSQLHLCRVGMGKVGIIPCKMVEITGESDLPRADPDDTRQPVLARSWKEFKEFCEDRRLGTGEAIC